MKTFISAADIEALVEQGVRELTVDEDTVLTSVARESAAQLGVKIVTAGASAGSGSRAREAAATTRYSGAAPSPVVSGGKPKGCQHGPISGAADPTVARTGSPAGPADPRVVDELIGAIKQMAQK